MNRGDQLIERGADKLQRLAEEAARKGGFAAKLAPELADDAAFLRKLKPSLIGARARGQAATDGDPGGARVPAPAAPQIPQSRPPRPTRGGRKGGGPNPWLVVGAAFAAGIVLAKIVDWRGHAHPRD
jgi:hypothetical protein